MIRNDTVTADGHKLWVEDKGHGLLNIDITNCCKRLFMYSLQRKIVWISFLEIQRGY